MPATATRQKPRQSPFEDVSEDELQAAVEELERRDKSDADDIAAAYASTYAVARPEDEAPKRRHYMYWAKCDRPGCHEHREQKGYLTHDVGYIGPGGAALVSDIQKNTHATPLPEFGQYVANNQAQHGARDNLEPGMNSANYNPNRPWGNFTDLFRAPGGVHRMPIEQFLQCGFHRDPILAAKRWEDIQTTAVYYCEDCPNSERYFTQVAHLNNHATVWHKSEQSARINSRAMAKNIEAQTESINNLIGSLVTRPAQDGDTDLIQELRAMRAELEELKKGQAS